MTPSRGRLARDQCERDWIWDREVETFWQVVPKEMLGRLPQPLSVVKEKRA